MNKDKDERPRIYPEYLKDENTKFNLFGVMNSISNYVLFRFWMIVLGILGWVLFFFEYYS
jgi:hypothetical protein